MFSPELLASCEFTGGRTTQSRLKAPQGNYCVGSEPMGQARPGRTDEGEERADEGSGRGVHRCSTGLTFSLK
jgi:hypothetical protein